MVSIVKQVDSSKAPCEKCEIFPVEEDGKYISSIFFLVLQEIITIGFVAQG